MSVLDLESLYVDARAACKRASCWAYRNNYAGGPQTISRRTPDDHSLHLTSLRSWHYAKEADVSASVALSHLRKLAAAGLIVERKRISTCCDFTLRREEAISVGEELIAELRAEGLPFDDEWRASRA